MIIVVSDGYRYRKFSPPFADAVGKDMVGVIDRGTLTVISKYIFVQVKFSLSKHTVL